MCGICGTYLLKGSVEKARPLVQKANDAIQKRGPDGGEIFSSDPVVLGHRRLSIIDVSCAGDQPMTTPDGRFTIVFNGEIFNYQELRSLLTAEEQASLRSTSDTEVFLLLYARIGTSVFEKLRGFFAAALFDRDTRKLVLVRDRYGKKPMLIYRNEEAISFASEMKALFAMGIPRALNWDVLKIYLQLNYIPQPHSMIMGVEKLDPGSFMTLSPEGTVTTRYAELKMQPEQYGRLSYEQAKEELVRKMDDAVRLRLISDVPLGSFLSGGIDSSVVVALASRHTDKLKTFSIGYKDHPYFDETSYANLVAKKYNTEHTVFSLGNNDFLEHITGVLDYMDEPFADSSAIPEFILSYHTRKHVTVALSGDGGDEVFAGYNKHAAEYRMRKGGVLNNLVKAGYPAWSVLPKSRNNKLTNTFRQLHRFASGARKAPGARYWQWASFQTGDQAAALLSPEIKQKITTGFSEKLERTFSGSILGTDFNELLLADMNLVLLSDMLVKVDLMSMANSLEIRSPFLDQEVVEFAFGLPASYKIDSTLKKRIVQDAFRPMLPEELYNRPKQGFEIPLLDWFRKELWGLINDDLLGRQFCKRAEYF
jgi:asparagine synthase (glutamine-hydrolysing)